MCGECEVIQVYDVFYFSDGEFSWKASGVVHEQWEASARQSEADRRNCDDSDQKVRNEPGLKPSAAFCGTAATKRSAKGRTGQTRAADPGEPPLPYMRYDDTLTTSEACIRLWIAVVLADKVRGDRLTSDERKISSLLGLEPSWVQRMIDKAPTSGKVCRPGFT